MSDSTEAPLPIDKLRRYASAKGRKAELSTSLLDSASTGTRDDLDAILTRSFNNKPFRPQTTDALRTKKRTHVADLLIDQTPETPVRGSSSLQRQIPSPTSIGIALGSPTHCRWVPPGHDRPSMDSSMPSFVAPPFNIDTFPTSGIDETSKLQPKRKLFNSIFGRKNSNAAQTPFQKSQPLESPITPATPFHRHDCVRNQDQFTSSPKAPATPRWNEMTRKPSVGQLMRKPSLGFRSKLTKSPPMPPNLPTINIPLEAPSSPPKDTTPPSPISSNDSPQPAQQPSPMLNVQIPDVTMERYSIMFSDVLKPQQSLLARRQTHLRGLQIIDDGIPDFSTSTSETLPVRRATAPSPRSPRLSVSPTPSSALKSNTSYRTGLSRSNTVPSPNRQNFATASSSQLKESQSTAVCSPSHGSETPISMHSDWPSDGSIDISEPGEDSNDETTSGDIIIQLGDLSIPHGTPFQPFSSMFSPSKHAVSSSTTLYQPNLAVERPSSKGDEMKHSPRTSSRAQFTAPKSQALSTPAVQRKASLPTGVRSIGGVATRQNTSAPTSKPQSATNKAIPYFNPLQSSPATPSEITIARQMSLSRVHSPVTPVAKTARQPQPITIINTDSFPEPKGWKVPLPIHMRNKSEHVVLESA